jgi:hypothetical protein
LGSNSRLFLGRTEGFIDDHFMLKMWPASVNLMGTWG